MKSEDLQKVEYIKRSDDTDAEHYRIESVDFERSSIIVRYEYKDPLGNVLFDKCDFTIKDMIKKFKEAS